MSKKSLTDRAVDGIAWQFIAVGGNIFLRAAILILLTRSLGSREFGIIAAATVILNIAERVGLVGVNRVLVQRQDLTDTHIASAFAISLWAGALLTVPIYLGADLFADWLNIPELTPYVQFLSISLLIGSVSSIPIALLERDLRFKALSIAEIGSYVLGFGLIALPLAHYGFGAWALAIGAMVQVLSRMVVLYMLRRHPVAVWPARHVLGDLIHPGVGFSAGQIGNFIATQVDNLIVGRMLGAEALGYYNRAYQFLMLPAQLFGKAVASVLFPTMAAMQDQPQRVARGYVRAVGLIALLTLPTSGFLIIIAPELVRFLLGNDWIGMIVPFQILIASLLFRTSYKISDAVTLAMGSMRARAWRQWIYAALVAAGAIIGARWGLTGVAVGVGLAVVANFLMMLQLARKILQIRIGEVVRVHLLQLRTSAILCLPAWLVAEAGRQFGLSDFLVLASSSLAAALAAAMVWFLFRGVLGELGDWLANLMAERWQQLRQRRTRAGQAQGTGQPALAKSVEMPEGRGMAEGRTASTPVEVEGALGVLPPLLQRLHAAKVRFGVYKNVADVGRAARGDTDFDLLLDPADEPAFRKVMNEMGAVLGTCSALYDNAVPGRQDWFVPDPGGNALHLDVSFGLRIGRKFRKRYLALQHGDVTDWREMSFGGEAIPVVGPGEEARIAVVRSAFRLGGRGWIRLGRDCQTLLARWLGDTATEASLEFRIGGRVLACPVRRSGKAFGVSAGAIRALRAALRGVALANPLSRWLAPVTDLLVHALRKGSFAVARRWAGKGAMHDIAKRQLLPSGVIVALIGPDGVGKSTQSARLSAIFARKVRAGAIYMGSNDGSWMAWRGRLRKAMSRLRGKQAAKFDRETRINAPLTYRKALGRSAWRLIIAIQRCLAVRRCERLCERGVVVIADRWPQALRQGYLDGPSVPPPAGMRLPRWLWGLENRLYSRMANHQPSLAIHLDCDFATSNARKPGDISEPDFELRVALMREMRAADPNIRIVDARQGMEAITADLAWLVWQAMHQRQVAP